MTRRSLALTVLFIILSAVPSRAAAPVRPLSAVPTGDSWFLIVMDGDNRGFVRQTITATADGYDIAVEGSAKVTVMGFTREAVSREHYRVGRDLTLRSFAVDQTMDGSSMRVSGETVPKGVKAVVETAGRRKEKLLKAKGAVYPLAAVNLYPLLQGVATGSTSRMQVLEPEDVTVKEVKITVEGRSTGPDGTEIVHLSNNLHSPVSNEVWITGAGETRRESVRDGLVETVRSDADTVRRFMLDSAVAKKDLILEFSLVRVDPPIARPAELKQLTVELAGVPAEVALPVGGRQRAVRDGAVVRVTVDREAAAAAPLAPEAAAPLLAATDRIPADHPDIVAVKDAVLKGEKDPARQVRLLADWVARTVEDTVYDSQSPLETLKNRSGNCQSHARLYTALARAAGIPTRFVSGLVYVEGKGFLYHSWAESYVGYWLALDPTFNQVPADATHIVLAVGESAGDMAPVAALVGRIGARVTEARY